MSVRSYYSNIMSKASVTNILSTKPVVCVTTILVNSNTQLIKNSTLLKTMGNYALTPLEPGNTLNIYDDNNILLTSIYRGTNDNSMQLSQDNGGWINMGSPIIINGNQFNLLALGSPVLWEYVGKAESQNKSNSISINKYVPQYDDVINNNNNKNKNNNFILTLTLLFVIISIAVGIYISSSKKRKHNRYSDYDEDYDRESRHRDEGE